MTTESSNRITSLALPDETQFRHDIQAINRFQTIVHQNLIANQDYGVIPGTRKPTLLKPGAEKIAKLLGLADRYEIADSQENWDKPFFRYLIRCTLTHIVTQAIISEGLGECNSMEGKYRWRWVGERDLPFGTDMSKLVKQERQSKTGGHWFVYRLENEDIFSQVNTILKMAKKRALVDAALSAGRLSNIFTQDIEDMTNTETIPPGPELAQDAPETKTSSTKAEALGNIPLTPEEKAKMESYIQDDKPKLVTAKQINILGEYIKQGVKFSDKITEYGWKARSVKELTFDQAKRLIEEQSILTIK